MQVMTSWNMWPGIINSMPITLPLVLLSTELIMNWNRQYFIHNLQVMFLTHFLLATGKDQLLQTMIDGKLLDIAAMKLRFIHGNCGLKQKRPRPVQLRSGWRKFAKQLTMMAHLFARMWDGIGIVRFS